MIGSFLWLHLFAAAASVSSCSVTPITSLEIYHGVNEDHNTYLQVQGEAFGLRPDARPVLTHRADTHIAALCNGTQVIIWNTYELPPAGRIVDTSGNRLSSDFIVAQGEEIGSQMAVAPLTSGGFVVLWKSQSAGSNTIAIRGRLFGADGRTAGKAFPVSTDAGNNHAPSAIPMADGGFLASWSQFPDEVHLRKFGATGIPQSPDTTVYDADSDPGTPRTVLATAIPTPEGVVIFVSDDHDMHDPAAFVAATVVDSSGKPSQPTVKGNDVREVPGYQLAVERIAKDAAEQQEWHVRSLTSTPSRQLCGSTSARAAVIEAHRMQTLTREPRMQVFFTNVCSMVLSKCGPIQFFESEHRECAAGRVTGDAAAANP